MALFAKTEKPVFKTFLYTSLAGGIVEYLISFLQETFTNSVSWDYSQKLLNINGRTTIIFMMFWGLLGVIFVYIIYPFLSNSIEKIPKDIGNKVMPFIVILMCLNMFISFSAVIRQNFRRNDVKPFTHYGKFLDKYYDDERLKQTLGYLERRTDRQIFLFTGRKEILHVLDQNEISYHLISL